MYMCFKHKYSLVKNDKIWVSHLSICLPSAVRNAWPQLTRCLQSYLALFSRWTCFAVGSSRLAPSTFPGREPLEMSGRGFVCAGCRSRPTVAKQWRKLKALTQSVTLDFSFLHPPPTSWWNEYCCPTPVPVYTICNRNKWCQGYRYVKSFQSHVNPDGCADLNVLSLLNSMTFRVVVDLVLDQHFFLSLKLKLSYIWW